MMSNSGVLKGLSKFLGVYREFSLLVNSMYKPLILCDVTLFQGSLFSGNLGPLDVFSRSLQPTVELT